MFDKGIFGGLFDFNGDGKMDTFEKAAEFSFLMNILEEESSSADGSDGDSED